MHLGSSHHSRAAEITTNAVIGLNKTSEYNADFNPLGVLEGILSWSEAEMYRNKSHLVSQSSVLANVGSDDSDDDTVMETISQFRRWNNMQAFHQRNILIEEQKVIYINPLYELAQHVM